HLDDGAGADRLPLPLVHRGGGRPEDLVTRRHRVLWAFAALSTAACASDPAPPCGLHLCDIRDADCQSMAAAAAACLRGVDPVTVPVTVVPRDEFIAQAAATPLTPEQEESFRRWNAG